MHHGLKWGHTGVIDMFTISRLLSNARFVALTFVAFSLSAGILGGVLFYMDSINPSVYHSFTEDSAVDMQLGMLPWFYSQNEITIQDILDALDQYPEVESTATAIKLGYRADSVPSGYSYSMALGITQDLLDKFPNAISISSASGPLQNDTCYLEETFMYKMDLSIGDNYTLQTDLPDSNYHYSSYFKSFKIVGTFQSDLYKELSHYFGVYESGGSALRLVTTLGGILDTFQNVVHDDYRGIMDRIFVKLDHTKLVTNDPQTTSDRLNRLSEKMEQDFLPYVIVPDADYSLKSAISEYLSWIVVIRGVGILFSMPTFMMGIMLIYYTDKLLEDRRRRDIGTLKTRGSSGRQAFWWVISSSGLISIIACAGTVVVGVLLTYLSASVRSLFMFDFTLLSGFSILLTMPSLIFVVFFSFLLGLFVTLPSAIKALVMTPMEAHAEIEKSVLLNKQDLGNPGYDLAGLFISGYLLLPIIFISTLGYMYNYLASYVIVLIPFISIFILSFARLGSRPIARIKSRVLGRIRRPSLLIGSRLLARSMKMFQRNEAIGVVFVTLIFTTSIFTSIGATTGYQHTYDLFMFSSGADLQIQFKNTANITTDWIDNLTSIQGIHEATGIWKLNARIEFRTQLNPYSGPENYTATTTLYGIDPVAWKRIAFLRPDFAFHGTPFQALDQLAQSNSSIITDSKPIDHWQYINGVPVPIFHDNAAIIIEDGHNLKYKNHCTIADVFANGDTGAVRYLTGQPDASRFALINLSYLHGVLKTNTINIIYASLDSNANYDQVIQDVRDLGGDYIQLIKCGPKDMKDSLSSRASQAVYGVYTLDLLFSLLYLTIGIGIVTTLRSRKFSKQFSVLRALGTDNNSILVPMLIDLLLTLFYALLLGSVLGLILSVIALGMPLVYYPKATQIVWTRIPLLIIVPWVLLLSLIAVTILFSLGCSYLIISKQLRKNIAEDMKFVE